VCRRGADRQLSGSGVGRNLGKEHASESKLSDNNVSKQYADVEPNISGIQQVVVWHIARWRATAANSDTMQRIRFLGAELAEHDTLQVWI
jgi:hypothetical protein